MSAHTTTNMANTIAIKHSHLMMHVLAQNLVSAMLHVASTVLVCVYISLIFAIGE